MLAAVIEGPGAVAVRETSPPQASGLALVRVAQAGLCGTDRKLAAGMLDVLWSVVSYERLVTDWELSPADAIRAITWAIGLVQDAVHSGRGPGS